MIERENMHDLKIDKRLFNFINNEVLKGLNPNERVVKEGLARLADGMTVRPLTK